MRTRLVHFGFTLICLNLNAHAIEGAINIRQISASGTTQNFEFQATYASDTFMLAHNRLHFSGYLPIDVNYQIRQVNIPAGWSVTNIACTCFQSNIPSNNPNLPCKSTWDADIPNATVDVQLLGHELMECSFVDTFEPCTGAGCEPSCGDGVLDPGEACDNGSANSDSAFGPGSCNTKCEIGPVADPCVLKAIELAGCDATGGGTSQSVLVILAIAVLFGLVNRHRRQAQ